MAKNIKPDHIGRDSAYHCTKCNHHHCLDCMICHRCGCREYRANIKERKRARNKEPDKPIP